MNNELIKIAIADDQKLIRTGIAQIINSFGEFKVIIEAINGQDLMDKIRQSPELPDICVIDINMPVMNGYETSAAIRKTWPKIKCLALSMVDMEYSVIKMLRNGCMGYLMKDCDDMELKNALLKISKNVTHYSDHVSGKLIHDLQNGSKNDITDPELEFLKYCCTDLTYDQIGEKMNRSGRTVEGYRNSLFKKLEVNNRVDLVIFAMKIGLV
jgi:two-component system, NarL family, invasion response regulator UvrY